MFRCVSNNFHENHTNKQLCPTGALAKDSMEIRARKLKTSPVKVVGDKVIAHCID
ncbi:MAG: hypothetical protein ACOX7X_02305 [Methanosarcina flavescens]|uniref:Uncharacterized protein n=1 Tax=Methanosarcina flavescens TaxID=1715806 RepID=A0A7K4AT89_9EURY|nr:hypothetical protein [Methanosarcina flavescens]NLK31917.1 hypothetical protein [Methanosarcina flavescens]